MFLLQFNIQAFAQELGMHLTARQNAMIQLHNLMLLLTCAKR